MLPKSIRDLLAKDWEPLQNDEHFEDRFKESANSPAYFYTCHGDAADLSFADSIALRCDGVLEGLSANVDGVEIVNEHAQHAIVVFCCNVAREWEKLQNRLSAIESTPIHPGFTLADVTEGSKRVARAVGK